jgi:hypothetical protein
MQSSSQDGAGLPIQLSQQRDHSPLAVLEPEHWILQESGERFGASHLRWQGHNGTNAVLRTRSESRDDAMRHSLRGRVQGRKQREGQSGRRFEFEPGSKVRERLGVHEPGRGLLGQCDGQTPEGTGSCQSDAEGASSTDRRNWSLSVWRAGLLLGLALGVLPGFISTAEEPTVRAAPSPSEVPPTPLRTLSTVRAFEGDWLAWSGQPLCDDDENAYFLLIPRVSPRDIREERVGADAFNPRDVIRVSSDGKKRTTFSPNASSKLAGATDIFTVSSALGRDGTLFLLVWARWSGETTGQPVKRGQYVVSFDRKGEYRSTIEVDSEEIIVQQFEVFGSGQFLLRGRRSNTAEARVAILSSDGGSLRDVVGWPGFPSAPLEDLSPTTVVHFDQMVRGGDGRIYVAEPETREDRDVVYAFGASGETEQVFKLRAMPTRPRLMGWKAAGDRFAAIYLQPEQHDNASAGEVQGKWWIAVYNNVTDAAGIEMTIYGPTPGPPICYQHKDSKDLFTFLEDGSKLLAMSSP